MVDVVGRRRASPKDLSRDIGDRPECPPGKTLKVATARRRAGYLPIDASKIVLILFPCIVMRGHTMSSIEEGLEAGTPSRESAVPDGPAGIGGWLLLVAVGQLLATFGLPISLAYQYLDPETLKLFGEFPWAMYGELALNVAIIVLALVTTLLLFRKSRHFPRVFILECAVGALLPALGLVWIAVAFSSQLGRPIGDFLEIEPREIYQFALGVISAVIWIAYTLRSKRVRNTFILGLSAQDMRDEETEDAQVLETPLLLVFGAIVLMLGVAQILLSVGKMVDRGAFNGQFVGGAVQVALALWLLRGSDVARIILAFLFALGVALCLWIAFLLREAAIGAIAMLAFALLSAGAFWILVFSKRFRAELAINAAKYRKPDVEAASET
jgi:hypothetical protein